MKMTSAARERLAELLIAPHAGIRDPARAERTYSRAMAFHHEVSTEIRFVTDGRVYEPVGRRAGASSSSTDSC
ncbi:hypothetical protein [Cellulomonas sp. HD19AZ1]|uniref:hypothetical protein n=1 Tax=Cellulomonas sp. HD19AZ1 TaxID=2559593 RepID=UPI0010709FD7|nr:hypothetical protein [Cellulomonas sp. HD19AZ1]TFH71169.1 hypothetical protein E4A51_09995 [Cellulomonas sp. HD19AZ1]